MPTDDVTGLTKPEFKQLTTAAAGYDDLLRDIKAHAQTAQVRAALAVNKELVLLYWSFGNNILLRQ